MLVKLYPCFWCLSDMTPIISTCVAFAGSFDKSIITLSLSTVSSSKSHHLALLLCTAPVATGWEGVMVLWAWCPFLSRKATTMLSSTCCRSLWLSRSGTHVKPHPRGILGSSINWWMTPGFTLLWPDTPRYTASRFLEVRLYSFSGLYTTQEPFSTRNLATSTAVVPALNGAGNSIVANTRCLCPNLSYTLTRMALTLSLKDCPRRCASRILTRIATSLVCCTFAR
mmetsp:Transcript_142372/g.248274  ORF Transcript_142372/g.248274 Transcript_142372/m.248274 type:complete len:226 (+) Transcript_142372:2655-3332(+)